VENHRVIECSTHEEIGLNVAYRARLVSEILSPMLWDTIAGDELEEVGARGYNNAPMEYLVGDFESVTVEKTLSLFKAGRIPRVCMSRVMHTYGNVKFNSEDTAWCRVEWLKTNCKAKYLVDYDQVSRHEIRWEHVLDPQTDWFKWFPPHSKINLQRANITLRSLFNELAIDHDVNLLLMLNTHRGATHGFITSLIVYYFGVVMEFRDELYSAIMSSWLLLVPEQEWVDVHKNVHAMVRVTGEFNGVVLTDDEYPLMQYTNTLVGRKTYTVDPAPELEKRRVLRLDNKRVLDNGQWSQAAYIEEFENQLRLCTQSVVDGIHNIPYTDFLEFLRQRYAWATKGGLTRCPKEFRETEDVVIHMAFKLNEIEEKEEVRIKVEPNKKSALEDEQKLNKLIMHIFNNEGFNDSGVSTKPNESGKERVLFPGSFMHFIVVSYILYIVERGGPVGNVMVNLDKSAASAFKHHDRRLDDDDWKFMYDFPDHNAYHSIYEMQAVMAAHGLFCQTEHKLAQRMVRWVVLSFENMTIDGEAVNSGLYSGWRCTSWVNTVLNHVYMACAVECFRRKHGYLPIKDYEGTGDDVDITMLDAGDAYRLYDIMMEMGYEDNEIKQLVTKKCHEFMRMIYTSNKIYSCVNRALPGFVCGDLERTGASPEDSLKSGYINIAMLLRRGLSKTVCLALEQCVVKRYGRFKNKDGEYEPMSKCLLHAHVDDGGFGIPDEKGRIWRLQNKIKKPDSHAIQMKATKYDMTRQQIFDSINELEELGVKCQYSEEKVKEMAMASISMEGVNRAMVDYMNSEEFVKYWTFTSEVVSYDTMEEFDNKPLLIGWLESMDLPTSEEGYREIVKFDKLCVMLAFSKTSRNELAEMMASTNGYDYISAVDFTVDQRYANLVPEWANSAISRYCRTMVLTRQWTREESEQNAKEILCTYSKAYRFTDYAYLWRC
jgi:hypothetical protein